MKQKGARLSDGQDLGDEFKLLKRQCLQSTFQPKRIMAIHQGTYHLWFIQYLKRYVLHQRAVKSGSPNAHLLVSQLCLNKNKLIRKEEVIWEKS